MTSTYISTHEVNDALDLHLAEWRRSRELYHKAASSWSVHPDFKLLDAFDEEPQASDVSNTGNDSAIYDGPEGSLLDLSSQYGTFYAYSWGATAEQAELGLNWVKDQVPEHTPDDPKTIPVCFWSHSSHGASMRRRELDAESWDEIAANYPKRTRSFLDQMLTKEFTPGFGGQLLLWHGEPGTGKTTVLRALAREWRDWCDCHYIVDPEEFFGSQAEYLLSVLMAEAEDNKDGSPRWRILVLEDCGELLRPDARKEVGQALSRLLNACDGLIGRGLRMMLLITTNEPIDKLHDAVARPGRCAVRIPFHRFTPGEADHWLSERDLEAPESRTRTLAELYEIKEGYRKTSQEKVVGFA